MQITVAAPARDPRLTRPDLLHLQGAPGAVDAAEREAEREAQEQEDLDLAMAISASLGSAAEDEERRDPRGPASLLPPARSR